MGGERLNRLQLLKRRFGNIGEVGGLDKVDELQSLTPTFEQQVVRPGISQPIAQLSSDIAQKSEVLRRPVSTFTNTFQGQQSTPFNLQSPVQSQQSSRRRFQAGIPSTAPPPQSPLINSSPVEPASKKRSPFTTNRGRRSV